MDKQNEDTQTDETQKTGLQWHPAFYAGIQIEFEIRLPQSHWL
jgi:hypothetical protein